MLQKVEGIVIRTTDYGEANKILTLYTRELGKIGVMARGAKRPKSRLSSISQLFTHGQYVFQKTSGLGVLNQGEMIQSFRDLREDLFLTAYGAYIVELLDKLTEQYEINPYLYELLFQTLKYIDEGLDYEVLTRIFEVKMLKVAGIGLYVDGCSHCGATEGEYSFSVKEGGFLCHRCLHVDERTIKISSGTAKLLRLFYHFDLNRLGAISVKTETKVQLKQVLECYFDEYSGLYLKSKRFLNQIDKMKLE
ncbi:DNA repair protein RecO [Anaerobacillus isosaccharinicus]|uniref:DNA repair protein RecO n=1 Tax=Anaerobacillus isosaccharinicus TaxID=1532552 RepID=A0A1S2LTJ0_9BACI|nr:DNA repair protein RecO [Anaerobacillus isosaccharinicus]MBA5585508.1 DNA repair protein RecO [Anaerobacillus isosaccharinicus]QOY36178.1 DNA repair protein RecO [Anaerobacillus isosaccharinicus]